MTFISIKNLLYLSVVLALGAIVFSCSEDLPPAEEANDNLNGTWTASAYSVAGISLLGVEFGTYELTFTKDGATNGSFSARTTDIAGTANGQLAATYEVLEEGSRIKIGSDTLDMTVSASNLTLIGESYFNLTDVSITASK